MVYEWVSWPAERFALRRARFVERLRRPASEPNYLVIYESLTDENEPIDKIGWFYEDGGAKWDDEFVVNGTMPY